MRSCTEGLAVAAISGDIGPYIVAMVGVVIAITLPLDLLNAVVNTGIGQIIKPTGRAGFCRPIFNVYDIQEMLRHSSALVSILQLVRHYFRRI